MRGRERGKEGVRERGKEGKRDGGRKGERVQDSHIDSSRTTVIIMHNMIQHFMTE